MLRNREEEEPRAHVSELLRPLSCLGLVPEDRISKWTPEHGILAGNAFIVGPLTHGPEKTFVGFIRVAPLRYRVLEGELARWLLLTQNRSEPRMLIVEVPSLTDRVVETVRELLEAWAPGVAWAVQDAYGEMRADLRNMGDERGMVHVPATETPVRLEPAEAPSGQVDSVKWTDAYALLAKWLFLARLHRAWGVVERAADHAPRNAPGHAPRNAPDLARCVGVSPQTAYSFLDTFKRAGLIEVSRAGVDIPDAQRFVDAWLAAARQEVSSWNRYPVQWHGGPVRSRNDLLLLCEQLALDEGDLIVGGFAAAELQGWLHVHGYPLPMLHWCKGSGGLESWMEDRGIFALPPADARDAHFWIAEPPWARSVWALHTPWPPGPGRQVLCRIVDPLQMAMDCIGEPRGEEQANELAERLVLARNTSMEWQ